MAKRFAGSNGSTRWQSLLATAAVLASSTVFASPSSVKAQGVPIALGVSLGISLLTTAARHVGSNSNTNNSYNSSWGSSSIFGGSRSNRNAAISVYNKAVKLFNSKNYADAITLLDKAAQIDPRMGNVYALLGACQLQDNKYQEAMQNFELAEKFGHHYEGLLFDKGVCASRLHDYTLAQTCFQQSCATNRHGAHAEFANKALQIVQHNFVSPSDDDYLKEAGREGLIRWNNEKPLSVYIEDNKDLKGYHAEFAQILRDSFQDWSKGTNGKVAFVFTEDASTAQIKCSWTDNQSDFADDKELGVTRVVYSAGAINSADIKLFTLIGFCKDNASELFPQAKCVALHEIGHALGLQHSSEPFDTMFPVAPPKGLEFPLTKRDLNTVTALYGQSNAVKDIQAPKSFSELGSK